MFFLGADVEDAITKNSLFFYLVERQLQNS
jgi:hypothetical protein